MADPFDVGTFTLGELADIERVVGVPLDQFSRAPSRARLIAALVWTRRKRDNPDVTLDTVLAMTLDDMLAELGLTEENPTQPVPAVPVT